MVPLFLVTFLKVKKIQKKKEIDNVSTDENIEY